MQIKFAMNPNIAYFMRGYWNFFCLAEIVIVKFLFVLCIVVSHIVLSSNVNVAYAIENESLTLDANWRPGLRRTFVLFGSSDLKTGLADLVLNRPIVNTAGVPHSSFETKRAEIQLKWRLAQNFSIYARLMGGSWQVKFNTDELVQNGIDWNSEIGAQFRNEILNFLTVESLFGTRLRVWEFAENSIQSHKNIGLIIGLNFILNDFSLLFENSLAALPLGRNEKLGSQKDSSALRIRPQWELDFYDFKLHTAFEYFHNHTQFFGSKVVKNQTAFMIDDLELAMIIGTKIKF